jgi:Tol biopolymer transport system component
MAPRETAMTGFGDFTAVAFAHAELQNARGFCEREQMMTLNWVSRIGRLAVAAALLAGIYAYGIRAVARAGEEEDPTPARDRTRTELLTLVDTIDVNRSRSDTFAASPDGTRMAWASLDEQGRGHVVIDGKAGTNYAGLFGKPVFSPDSRRVAHLAMNTQNLWFVVADGVENRNKYPSVKGHSAVAPDLLFSLDGRRLAYVVFADIGGAGKQFVVVDREVGSKYDEIAGLAISPNGERLAYAARTGNQWAVVVDGREGPRHEGVLSRTPVFSPDGRHVAYGGREGRRFFVVVDRKRGRDYDELGGMVFFSPDSARVVYSPSVGRRRAVVVNEEEIGLYERVDDYSFVFSADGKHLAYKAGDAQSWFVVVDGKRGRSYAGVGRPVFTPDGSKVAHSACDRCGGGSRDDPAMFVAVDGQRVGAAYADIAYPIQFSADGRQMAFVAKRGAAQFVVADEREERIYAGVAAESLAFSPSGRDLVYTATSGAGKHFVVVSGVEGREFDAVEPRGLGCRPPQGCGVLFDNDRSFRYLAWQRDRVYLVRNSAGDH